MYNCIYNELREIIINRDIELIEDLEIQPGINNITGLWWRNKNKGEYIAICKSVKNIEKRCFILAHELGHSILHKGLNNVLYSTNGTYRSKIEEEANAFAYTLIENFKEPLNIFIQIDRSTFQEEGQQVKKQKKDVLKASEVAEIFYQNLIGDLSEEKEQVLKKINKQIETKSDDKPIAFYNKQDIPEINKINYPNSLMIPRDKVSGYILDGYIGYDGEIKALSTERYGSREELTVEVALKNNSLESIAFINDESIAIPTKPLTRYDFKVCSVVSSLFILDNENKEPKDISYTSIYRNIVSNNKAKVTPNIKKEIEESLIKLSTTLLYLDPRKEAKAYPKLQDGTYRVPKYTPMLSIGQIGKSVLYNGQVADGWVEVLAMPYLVEYAYKKGHISQIPHSKIKAEITNNYDSITIKTYLENRIIRMKNSNISKKILFESAYKTIDLSRYKTKQSLINKKYKLRNLIIDILEEFKKNGFIRNFEVTQNKRNKNQDDGVLIEL